MGRFTIKILHVVQGYPPSIGGSQWLAKNLSEYLVHRHNDTVTVFTTVAYNMEHFWNPRTPAMSPGVELINGVTVRRFRVFNQLSTLRMVLAGVAYRLKLPYNDWLRTLYNGPLIPGLRRAVAQSGADVVLAMTFPLRHMYDTLAGARRAGLPCVLLGALHTADIWGYERPILYKAIHQADAYIALTSFERDYLIERGITADKISVTGGGVDAARFIKADGRALRQRYGWGDTPVILTLGKHTARKRFDVLLEAMPQVWREQPDAHLVIAGARGDQTPKLQQTLAGFPPSQQAQVTMIYDFPEAEKPALLAACDIFVLPSGEESFGIAFVEAWACGKPVVGSNIGAIPSVIAAGSDGLLAKYGNPESFARALTTLLRAPHSRSVMGSAGREKVLKHYTWDTVTDQVRAVYRRVTENEAALI